MRGLARSDANLDMDLMSLDRADAGEISLEHRGIANVALRVIHEDVDGIA
jgi:hypothetical protein